MFIKNKYYKYYYNIIDAAKSRSNDSFEYTEIHHIIPKSLEGTNSSNNLVKLSAREHFICHMLLIKMTSGLHKRSMVFAFNAMANLQNCNQTRYKSRNYVIARKLFSEQQSISVRGDKNPMFKKTHSKESKERMSKSHKGQVPWNTGKKLTDKHKEHISKSNKGENNSMFGKTHSVETKRKISDANKGHSYNKGIEKTDEHKMKISKSLKGKVFSDEHKNKLKLVPKLNCEKCGKLVSPAMYKRWHGKSCKV